MARTRNKTPIPENETKRQKFLRLANPRIAKIYTGMQSLGKLGTNAYERTDADVESLRAVLQRELDAVCEKLKPGAPGEAKQAGIGAVLS